MTHRIAYLLTVIGLAAVGCSSPTEPTATVSSVVVTPPAQTIASSGTTTLSAAVLDQKGRLLSNRILNWSSSDLTVATVSNTGIVTAAPNRTAATTAVTIAAESDGRIGKATIQILPTPPARLLVTPDTVTLLPGNTISLIAIAQDAGGAPLTGRSVSWTTSDATVVTISDSGRVTAPSFGGPENRTARIIAATSELRDTAHVIVVPLQVATVILTTDSVSMLPEDSTKIEVVLKDGTGTILSNRPLTWTSTDSTVASVSATGQIRATPYQGSGVRRVKIIVGSGIARDTLAVSVSPSPVVSIQFSSDTLRMRPNKTSLLSLSAFDKNGRLLIGRTASWRITDSTLASITATGVLSTLTYTGGLVRSAEVQATIGSVSRNIKLIVEPIPVGRIDILPTAVAIERGLSKQTNVAAKDSSGSITLSGREITWSSSQPGIANVTTTGLIVGISSGSATVVAKAEGVSGSLKVEVYELPSSVRDADGNVYGTVKIGSQLWFASNLKSTRYRDSTPIPTPLAPEQWSADTLGARAVYLNDLVYADIYGQLYTWYAVRTRKLCPAGWRVPTAEDWSTLASTLGGPEVAGGKMKAVSNYWRLPNTAATNESGFGGLPGSLVDNIKNSGIFGGMAPMEWAGYWWASDRSPDGPRYVQLWYSAANLELKVSPHSTFAFSIRCIFDPAEYVSGL